TLSLGKDEVYVQNNLENQFTKQLCRGVNLLNDTFRSELKCFHLNTAHIPFLRLTRVRVEEMHRRPQVLVIHQFLADHEIEVMKALAKPKLYRTSTVNEVTKEQQKDRHRVAEGGWLRDTDNAVVDTVSRRIAAITGMDIRAAEEYNAIKYGIGGYYAPHWDVFVPSHTQLHQRIYGDALNRLATWINYLSDVESGGATIFPHLNVTVWPEKGSAVLWHNLYKSGIVDLNTLHGGCPVLMGTKWIATKWIPELGQTQNQEVQWIHDLNAYIGLEEQRLAKIRQLTDQFTTQNSMAMKDLDTYLGHPIDVYLLIKRFAVEWKVLEDLLLTNPNVYKHTQNLILNNELIDAAKGMSTLVDTYQLDVTLLADGVVQYSQDFGDQTIANTTKTLSINQTLNAMDCYLIGKQSFLDKHYIHAIQWLNVTITRADSDTLPIKIKTNIYKYISLAYHKLGEYNFAVFFMQHSINLNPYNEKNLINQLFIELFNLLIKDNSTEEVIEEEEEEEEVYEELTEEIEEEMYKTPDAEETPKDPHEDIVSVSKELCRGVRRLNATITSQLKCFFLNTTEIPFLRLTRIKVEEKYKRPQIVVIYDFLSDEETDVMKALATPRLKRSTVVGTVDQGSYVVADSRVAEGGWLVESDHHVIDRLTRRISAITGLDAMSADSYNAIKYGVGGHYAYHYDVVAPNGANVGDRVYAQDLKRVATWINYLSDVDAGGDTIFPKLNVAIKPMKGAALFWYNLKASGYVDMYTLHGGCPVLVGAKWIATKWILDARQEFRKPCALDHDQYNLIDKYLCKREEQRLLQLRQLSQQLLALNEITAKDVDTYLGHPIGVYLLIKRMVNEWQEIQQFITTDRQFLRSLSDQMTNLKLIYTHDLTKTARGISRILKAYPLDIPLLATGLIKYNTSNKQLLFRNIYSDTNLTASDCYLIGKQSYDYKDYNQSIQWLEVALMSADNGVNGVSDEFRADILQYLSLSYYKIHDYNRAIGFMLQSIGKNPNSKHKHSKELALHKMKDEFNFENQTEEEIHKQSHEDKFTAHVRDLCRGDISLDQSIRFQLKCYYLNTTEIPFLRLTRIKVEEMYKRPDIVVIHDFISEQEIQTIKLLVQFSSQRSSHDSNTLLADVSKLNDTDHLVLRAVTQRISAITGLNVRQVSDYHVFKYNIGGHYAIHYDALPPANATITDDVYAVDMNRVATYMIYLSDVDAGGLTVFPYLNVTITPTKGSALFWYNLKSSGLIDMRTLHTGCPVLVGSKLIATKWIPESGQEFSKPCAIQKHQYHLLENKL
ncbi:unnamed protein product, partial [Medioppia subpectinata]